MGDNVSLMLPSPYKPIDYTEHAITQYCKHFQTTLPPVFPNPCQHKRDYYSKEVKFSWYSEVGGYSSPFHYRRRE